MVGQAPFSLAALGGKLYWTAADGVWTASAPMGAVVSFATATSAGVSVTDGSSLYWVDGAAVRACPLAGCGAGPRTLVSGSGVTGASLLAVGGAQLYLVTSSSSGDVVASCPLAGCAQPTTLANAAPRATAGLAVDAQNVYYTSAGTVYSVGIAGGTPTALTPSVLATVLAVDSAAIYWAATDGVEGTPTNAIVKMGK